jgi:hypothetical protein
LALCFGDQTKTKKDIPMSTTLLQSLMRPVASFFCEVDPKKSFFRSTQEIFSRVPEAVKPQTE